MNAIPKTMDAITELLEPDAEGVFIPGRPDLFVPEETLKQIDRIGEEMRAAEDAARAAGKVECANAICGEWFEPRGRSGGKPQKYCSEACRREADAGRKANAPNARQREAQRAECPVPGRPAPKPSAQAADSAALSDGDFDWIENTADVVLPEQSAVAVYENPRGDIVIRQEKSWCDEEDHVVCIRRENLTPLIDRLCDLAGIPSVGR